jgi:hypothetical protein
VSGHATVAALSDVFGERLPAASTASLPRRYAPYDFTPRLSVEAAQERVSSDAVACVTARLVGVVGACVSLDGPLTLAAAGERPDDLVAVGGVTGCAEGHALVLETTAVKPELFSAESEAPTAIVYAVPQESFSTVS